MRRHIVGILAIVLLTGGIVSWLWPLPAVEGFFWRLGSLMAVWWLAWNDLSRLPAWLLALIPVLVIVLAMRPRYVLLLIPVLIVIAILRPRAPRR